MEIDKGSYGFGTLSFTNNTDNTLRWQTGVPSVIVFNQKGKAVARWNGAIILPLYSGLVEPGDTADGPGFTFHLANCVPRGGWTLAPGEYTLGVRIQVFDEVTEEQFTATGAVPLTIRKPD